MHFGSVELQIFVSLCVLLAVGLVAFIVDYLKAVNADLRESNAVLRVRQEEQQKAHRRRTRQNLRNEPNAADPPQVNNHVSAGSIVFHLHEQGKPAIPVLSQPAVTYLPEPTPVISIPQAGAQQLWPTLEDMLNAPAIPPACELRVAKTELTAPVAKAEPEFEPAPIENLFSLQLTAVPDRAEAPPPVSSPAEETEPAPLQDLLGLDSVFGPSGSTHANSPEPPALEADDFPISLALPSDPGSASAASLDIAAEATNPAGEFEPAPLENLFRFDLAFVPCGSTNAPRIFATEAPVSNPAEEIEPAPAKDLFRLSFAFAPNGSADPGLAASEPVEFDSVVVDYHDSTNMESPAANPSPEPALVQDLFSLDLAFAPSECANPGLSEALTAVIFEPVVAAPSDLPLEEQETELAAFIDCLSLPSPSPICLEVAAESAAAEPITLESVPVALPEPATLPWLELGEETEESVVPETPVAAECLPPVHSSIDPSAPRPTLTLLRSSNAGLAPVQDVPAEEELVEQVFDPVQLPVGMQSRETLQQMLNASSVSVSGLLVAIGINDYESLQASRPPAAHDDLMRSVNALLESVLAGKGFGARLKADEFILVFPDQSGAAGQRLLTQVSERLWDFQLRSLSTMSILFSWGAVEAVSESLQDAIASANERMRQTKRTRTSDSRGTRRRAMAI